MSDDSIGLALSGGGYRASFFHLGALTRLHELGIAQRVTRLSAVSGGSILAGHLAEAMLTKGNGRTMEFGERWEAVVAAPFRKLARKDARTWPTIKYLFWGQLNPTLRVNLLRDIYHKHLTSRLLAELPRKGEGCEFIFLATDMTTGTSWRFGPETMYSYERRTRNPVGNTSIATAVAASACFPPLFGPLALQTANEGTVYLTDGGVYDNSGMEPVWKRHQVTLVSDAGRPWTHSVPFSYFGRLLRYADIARNQVRAQRHRALVERFRTAEKQGAQFEGALWRLDSKQSAYYRDGNAEMRREFDDLSTRWYGYSEAGRAAERIQNIRTDLDSFIDAECRVLENHGYFFADLAVRTWLRGRFPMNGDLNHAFNPPHEQLLSESFVEEALKHSHKRLAFWRRWMQR